MHGVEPRPANSEMGGELPLSVLDALPNPILVKDADTRYVWVNAAFERLFSVRRDDLVGRLDSELFPERQAVQCQGGDLRVLADGKIDEAEETVFDPDPGSRETITRKRRLSIDGRHYLVGVMHDITDVSRQNRRLIEAGRTLQEQSERLQLMASTDSLTGCLNRRALFERARELLDDGAVGVVSMDLDHFKAINDTYGHDGGDAVLVDFAERVRSELRPGDAVGRVGGEEFIAVLAAPEPGAAAEVAERIRSAVLGSMVGEALIRYTVSVGVIESDEGPQTLQDLVTEVDRRLYRAKNSGRNQIVATG